MAGRQKQSSNIEDLSDLIRLQLLYFDEANTVGHELSKLQQYFKTASELNLSR